MGCFLSLSKGLAEWMDAGNTIRGSYRGEPRSMDSIRNAETWI
jgi:hypothetical protein